MRLQVKVILSGNSSSCGLERKATCLIANNTGNSFSPKWQCRNADIRGSIGRLNHTVNRWRTIAHALSGGIVQPIIVNYEPINNRIHVIKGGKLVTDGIPFEWILSLMKSRTANLKTRQKLVVILAFRTKLTEFFVLDKLPVLCCCRFGSKNRRINLRQDLGRPWDSDIKTPDWGSHRSSEGLTKGFWYPLDILECSASTWERGWFSLKNSSAGVLKVPVRALNRENCDEKGKNVLFKKLLPLKR